MPQGSIVIGPLIFLLYINDLLQFFSIAKFVLYANDTTVIFKGSDIHALYNDKNIELAKIFDWYLDNKLAINFEKTNYLLFHYVSLGRFNPVLRSIMIGMQWCYFKNKYWLFSGIYSWWSFKLEKTCKSFNDLACSW